MAAKLDFFTVQEAAQKLRVSEITIRRLIDSQRLAAARVGRSIRIPRAALEAIVGEGQVSRAK